MSDRAKNKLLETGRLTGRHRTRHDTGRLPPKGVVRGPVWHRQSGLMTIGGGAQTLPTGLAGRQSSKPGKATLSFDVDGAGLRRVASPCVAVGARSATAGRRLMGERWLRRLSFKSTIEPKTRHFVAFAVTNSPHRKVTKQTQCGIIEENES
jgi:hypothetical protein